MARIALAVAAAMFVCILLTASVSAKSVPMMRSARAVQNDENGKFLTTEKPRYCSSITACGWQLYVAFDKTFVDYMPNTCICPEGLDCILDDDDISVSAYIFRCRLKKESSTEPQDNSS